jgi:hypothetical protein
MDERYFTGLGGRSYWHFAFTVFKKGQSEPVTDSVGMAFRGALRSDHVELDLEKGTYVVHVRSYFYTISFSNVLQRSKSEESTKTNQ